MTVSHLLFFPSTIAPQIPPLNPRSPLHLQPRHFLPTTIKPHFQFSIPFCFPISPLTTQFTARNSGADGEGEFEHNQDPDKLSIGFASQWVIFIRSVLPGGPWWNLRDSCEERTDDVKSISIVSALRRIWALIADDKWVVFAAFASLAIAAISEVSMPSLLAACIFSAQKGESMAFYRNSQLLMLLCITSGISSGLRGSYFGIANMILVKHLRESLYSAFLFQDLSFFDTEAVGNLTSRLGSDCQRLSRVIGNDLHFIFRNLVQGSGALINLLMLSQPLALSSLAICFVLSAIFLVYGPYQKEAAKVAQDLEACATEVAYEAFSLMKTIRAYGVEMEETWLKKLTFVNVRESLAYGLWNVSFNTLYRSTQILAVVFGGLSIIAGHMSHEQLTKYILYCEWLIYATWRLVDNLTSLLQSVGASERLFQLIDLLPSSQFSCKGVKLQQLRGDIEFVDVSFSYPTRVQALVLQHVNMSIRSSEVIAIVGPSGSGKSTLVKLLLRLFDPTDGEILVDGHPLKDLDIRGLRRGVGYVGQEPHLFNMDVKSNITYGCHRDVRWADVESAATLAYAHDFITSLPQGYDTLVDDDLLSGGQKQRIAIARAILRDPAILILDEATSALDAENGQPQGASRKGRTLCKAREIARADS
ncbi:hypothetical protein Cgig2_021648 [Carnegiea gigantea]|uniref:ABC transporter B family member 26, chloroplastic n=1 Tax=Carnegiea gigantea TaxID=171969 RepID=A0A9Q1QFG9_9CARY|nr:hypothetical protein Cgig2_021648 [Carnegiea gigantea]